MNAHLKNETTGDVEEAPMGYSWTTFFLGGLVPMVRGDWGTFFKYTFLFTITFGIYHFVFCAKYNKDYAKNLIMQGYRPVDEHSETCLKMNGVYLPS